MARGSARFDPCPTSEAGYEATRQYLRAEFARWAEDQGSGLGPDSFEELVHYKWGYLDGHLTRWSRADLDTVLLELFPAKMIVDGDELADIVPETAAFVAFLADTGLLDPESEEPQALCAHLETLPERFRERTADSTRYSPGKRFCLAATTAGVPLDDEAAVSAFIEQFNAQPSPERDRVLGRPLRSMPWSGTGRFTPPGTQPRAKPKNRRCHRGR